MKNKNTVWAVVIVLIFGISVWLANQPGKRSNGNQPFKIGVALPLTGAAASFGEEFRRGAEVAQDEINSTRNSAVEVIFEDTALQTDKAADAVTKLVNADGVDVVSVSAYSEAAATHAITDRKNLPMLVWWDSNPQLEAMGDKVFALGPWTPASGEITAEFVYGKNLKRAAVFGYTQEWSNAVSDAFASKLKSLGGVITDSEFSNPGATDYRTQVSKIIASNPDVIYVTVEDFFKGVKQIRDLGYKGKIITSDLLDNSQIEQAPGLFEGVYGSQVADPVSPETAHFLDLYKKKFGEDAKKIVYGAWGYDAIYVLYEAYSSAQGKNITASLYKVDYQGASGEIKFDKNGSSKTIPKMFIVKAGVITKVE